MILMTAATWAVASAGTPAAFSFAVANVLPPLVPWQMKKEGLLPCGPSQANSHRGKQQVILWSRGVPRPGRHIAPAIQVASPVHCRHASKTDGDESSSSSSRSSTGKNFAAAAIGTIAGGLGGALGLGGGFLVVPALTSLLDVEPRLAIGTSSCVVLAVSCVACPAYIAKHLASPRASLTIALSAFLTARFGATLTGKANPKTLKRLFGAWLIIVSSLIGSQVSGIMPSVAVVHGAGASASLFPLLALGTVTGLISGLLGVGGGTVLVPALTLLFGFPQKEAQGCALLGMILPSLVSASTHWRNGNVGRNLTGSAVAGALVGGWSGSMLAAVLPNRPLRATFSLILSLVGLKYLRS